MEGSTVFKILYEGDLRRWRVDDFVALPFPRFKEKICELYGLEDSDVTIKYTDEDGDNVSAPLSAACFCTRASSPGAASAHV